MNGEEKAIVGVKMANHKIIPVLTGEENAGHAVFTTVADNQKKAIFSFYYMDNGIDDWQPAGSMAIDGIPPAPAGKPDIDMYIRFTDSGDIVSEIGDSGSGIYKSYQISSKKLAEEGNRPVSHSALCGEDGGISVTGDLNLKNKKKSRRLKVILTVLIIITGVFITSKLQLIPELKVPGIVKTRFGKGIPKIHMPLDELIKTGQKSDLRNESKEKKNISGPTDEAQSKKTDKTDSKKAEVVSQSIKSEINTEPIQYRITWGDTLWKIAKRFYGESRLFPSIAQKNSISNPDRIIAGDTLQIPSKAEDSERIDKKDSNTSK